MTCDHPRYKAVFAHIEANHELNRLVWAYAESLIAQHLPLPDRLTGEPGWPARCWTMALTDDDIPMAWAAAQLTWKQINGRTVPFVLARESFHNPAFYHVDVYPEVFAAREETIRHLPGVTYVYAQIKDLHLAAGWEVFETGVSDVTGVDHEWWGMKRGW